MRPRTSCGSKCGVMCILGVDVYAKRTMEPDVITMSEKHRRILCAPVRDQCRLRVRS